jgi:hypothetical protein
MVRSDTDAAAVSFLIATGISLGGTPPGYAATVQASVWALRGVGRLSLACGAVA